MTATSLVAGASALDLVLRATLLIVTSWAAAAMLKKLGASAAARHLAWLLCIAALLILPIIWLLAPPLRLPILPLEAAAAVPAAVTSTGEAPPMLAKGLVESAAPITIWLLLAAYLIGVTALLVRLAASHFVVSRLWRDAAPVGDADWQGLLSRLSCELRCSRPVTLRIARHPVMPMTWGTLAPKILLPAEASAWPADRRRFVLLHELAHVAHRDSLGRTAASLACALYWFHPGAWFAARRLRLEQEYAADDRLLVLGAPARGYALDLLDLARRIGERSWPEHAAAMAGACQLERRVLAITTPARRDQPGLVFLSAAAVAATFVVLAAAAGMPVRSLSEPLDRPSIEPVSSAARSIPAADEGRASEPETAFPREDARPPDSYIGVEGQRSAPPPLPGQPEQAAVAQTGSPVPAQGGFLGGTDSSNALPPASQRETYGPWLPHQLAAAQGLDPRIPEPLRPRDASRGPQDDVAAGRSTAHSIARRVLQIVPTVLLVTRDPES